MGKQYIRNSLQKEKTSKKPSTCKYHYTPLPNNRTAIRLLKLHPAPDPSWPIRCSIFHTTLQAAPPYIALSYAWGEKTGSQLVTVDTEHILITPNLKHALMCLREDMAKEQRGELVLWVDAICIDQENIPERNDQTRNMRDVYQRAESVAVWLGLEYRGSAGALALVRDIGTCVDREEVVSLVTDAERVEDLRALVRLFRRSYWWRIWVVQEISSARKATVYCGGDKISWDKFDGVCDVFKEVDGELEKLFYKQLSYVRTLTHGGPRSLQLSRFSKGMQTPPLFELLVSHKSKESTEPRDKVYALVGVSSSREGFGVIDYNLEEKRVFTHTARHIIETTGKLDVICVKQNDENRFGLPSWAPDWTRPWPISVSLVIGLHHHEPEFRAAGDTMAEARFSGDGYVLHAKGVILDTIEAVGIPYKKRGAVAEISPSLDAFHDWWDLFAAKHSNSLSSQAVFARSISCGNWDFEDDNSFVEKLDAIFSLSNRDFSKSDLLKFDPPSRSSTMGASLGSLVHEGGPYEVDDGEKTQLSTMLNAGLTMNKRRLFLSAEGLVGLAPWNAEKGDVVCVLLGCRSPVVLRAVDGHYVLIGEAYVDGFMNGEALLWLEEERFVPDTFDIY